MTYPKRYPRSTSTELTEGAKFWLRVMSELKEHGTQDILVAVVVDLKGLPDARCSSPR